MSSSTSLSDPRVRSWRKLAWVGWLVFAIVIIEAAISILYPTSEDARRNFLQFGPGREELIERVLSAEKFNLFEHDDPVILQVGDSSGFHGVQPPIIEEKIGARYLNMSVFANQGYDGYYQVAKYMFDRNSRIKYLVLYITPAGQQPRPANVGSKNVYGDAIASEYNSSFHALFRLPSLGLRERVTNLVYYGSTDSPQVQRLRQPTRYMEAPRLLRQSGGWTREKDNADMTCGPIPGFPDCRDVRESVANWGRRIHRLPDASDDRIVQELGRDYGESPDVFDPATLSYVNFAHQVYERFRRLAQSHGAQLIISAAPVSDVLMRGETGEKLTTFTRTLHDYARAHPDVGVIDTVTWPDARFSSIVHVSTPFIAANSHRVAQALSDMVMLGSRASPSALTRGRDTAREIDMAAEQPPVYGFGPPVTIENATYRGIREGRYEALLFNRAPSASTMAMQVAPGTPGDVVQDLVVTVNGEKAEREVSTAPDTLRWRLPPAASRFGGWMEILLSTRGRDAWLEDALTPAATGPKLQISKLRFD